MRTGNSCTSFPACHIQGEGSPDAISHLLLCPTSLLASQAIEVPAAQALSLRTKATLSRQCGLQKIVSLSNLKPHYTPSRGASRNSLTIGATYGRPKIP